MLRRADGRAKAVRTHLIAEQQRGQGFRRLGIVLSTLYFQDGEEKRLLDLMLLAVTR